MTIVSNQHRTELIVMQRAARSRGKYAAMLNPTKGPVSGMYGYVDLAAFRFSRIGRCRKAGVVS